MEKITALSVSRKRKTDEYLMRLAIKEAEAAFSEGEVPVGAILVIKNRIIAKAICNKRTVRYVCRGYGKCQTGQTRLWMYRQ
jgi:hypothetical protein